MLKVLYINSVFGSGSTGRIISDLGSAIEKMGGEYIAAYGRGSSTNNIHGHRIGSQADVLFHTFMTRIGDGVGLYSRGVTRKLVEYIRSFNPDVIHLHNLHGYYVNIEILFDYLKNEFQGKVIWTLHDCWAFTGHCVHYTYANCSRWLTQCGDCPEKKRYPKSYAFDGSKRNHQKKKKAFTNVPNMTIVTPSCWLSEQVKRSFLKDYEVAVVNNGIDLSVFHPIAPEEEGNNDRKIVLNVSDGFDVRKGHLDLLELRKYLPDEYRIVVVGVDNVEAKYMNKGVEWIKKTSNQQELVSLYSKAVCLVNPTYEDTYPTINIEALACGTPVVAYNACGAAEIISKGSGVKVAPGDIEGLNRAIKSIIELTSKTECLAAASGYDKERMYSQYLEIYQRK